jgi:hypothetical protein
LNNIAKLSQLREPVTLTDLQAIQDYFAGIQQQRPLSILNYAKPPELDFLLSTTPQKTPGGVHQK